jgi:o-succinylbenzoate---CoA ligase
MKPLKLVPANDTFRALQLVLEVLDGSCAGFITAPEVNGLMPEVYGLPDQVAPDVGFIVESSGSTGTPKRIELSTAALVASAEASAKRIGSGQWLLALPVNFVAGLNVLVRSALADTQPVMLNTRVPFTAEAFVRGAMLMQGDSYTSLVPLQLSKLLQASRQDPMVFAALRKFKAILLGGQSPNWAEVSELRAMGVNIVVSYGMTETSGGCVYDGVPLDRVQVDLVDGRIAISGPVLANGLGEQFVSNDLGEIVDGKLEVLGRVDRVIISGGLKLSLDRAQEFALAASSASDVLALPVESEFGQSLALLYTAPGQVNFDFMAELSPAAKVAKAVLVPAIPRLPSGKPDLIRAAELIA